MTVRVKDEYHGCHTWVEIDRELPFEGTPVMAEEEFDRAAATIRGICEDAGELVTAYSGRSIQASPGLKPIP